MTTVTAKAFRANVETALGVGLEQRSGAIVIRRVDVDGLFATSNLTRGMKVRSINGVCVDGMSLDDVVSIVAMTVGEIVLQAETTSPTTDTWEEDRRSAHHGTGCPSNGNGKRGSHQPSCHDTLHCSPACRE